MSASTSEGSIYDLTWTNGLILDKQYKTASKYEIKEIKGDTYLFYEWKSGDYTIWGMQPGYYVLKKIK
jgi:bla regulator protein blaR1